MKLVTFVCENCNCKVEVQKRSYKNINLCRKCKISKTKNSWSDEKKNEVNTKREKTSLAKYGVKNPGASQIAKDHQKQTMIENYGSIENGYKHHQEKREKTLLDKYGVDNNAKRTDVKEKTKNTLIEKYGSVKNAYKQRKAAIEKTMMEHYGANTNLVFIKFKKYAYDNNFFDSSWELAYYIWLKDHNVEFKYHTERIEYIGDDGEKHFYYPDFIVDGKIVEIKGDQFFNENGEPFDCYHKCYWRNKYNLILQSGGKILKHQDLTEQFEYVKSTYGKHFLKECKL